MVMYPINGVGLYAIYIYNDKQIYELDMSWVCLEI